MTLDVAYAAAIAPEIDRLRISISRGIAARGAAVVDEFGLTVAECQILGMLRNLAPARSAERAAVELLFVYQSLPVAQLLDGLATAGFVAADGSQVQLSARGVAAVDALLTITGEVVDATWHDQEVDFVAMRALTAKVMDVATQTGGAAYSVMAPMYEPEFVSPATRFAESLTPLRFHRFDVHIAAWRAAGLTAAEMQALGDGPTKDAIEADTNARAAGPYAALTDEERATLLDALQSLPIVDV